MEREGHVCRCQGCREHPRSKTARLHRALNGLVMGADEKTRRRIAGWEAMKMGWGGITRVAELTGLDRQTIAQGAQELREGSGPIDRIRRKGAGRWPVEKKRRRGGGGS